MHNFIGDSGMIGGGMVGGGALVWAALRWIGRQNVHITIGSRKDDTVQIPTKINGNPCPMHADLVKTVLDGFERVEDGIRETHGRIDKLFEIQAEK
jgi:hypothetical protein